MRGVTWLCRYYRQLHLELFFTVFYLQDTGVYPRPSFFFLTLFFIYPAILCLSQAPSSAYPRQDAVSIVSNVTSGGMTEFTFIH